jgi:hypothetical protein
MSILDELSDYFSKTASNMDKVPGGLESIILTLPEKEKLGEILESISSNNIIKEEDKANISNYFSKITTAIQGAAGSVATNIPDKEKLEEIVQKLSQGISIPQEEKDKLSEFFSKYTAEIPTIPENFNTNILTLPDKENLTKILENISSNNIIKEEDKASISNYFSKITTTIQGVLGNVTTNIPEKEKLEEIVQKISQGISIPQEEKDKLSEFFSKYTAETPGGFNGSMLSMPDQAKLAEILEKMSKGITLDSEDKVIFDELLKSMSNPVSTFLDTCNESSQSQAQTKQQQQQQQKQEAQAKKKGGILAYIIGKIVYYVMIPIKMLMKALNQPVKAIELAKPSKKKVNPTTHKTTKVKLYFKALHATNVFPGILTVLIALYLIIFLLWTAIQGFFRWISGGSINLPNFPFSFDKTMTQMVYSFFYLVTSIYLIVYLFIELFGDLKRQLQQQQNDKTQNSSNMDLIEIAKRVVRSLYVLWPIAVIVVGSAIAKTFYKLSCGGTNTNISKFAKIVDSIVLLTLIKSIIFMVLLKVKSLLDIVVVTVKCGKKEDAGKSYQSMYELIFYFDLIYILLRLVSLTFEEFFANLLAFLMSKINSQVKDLMVKDCNEEEKKCKTSTTELKENIMKSLFALIIWLILVAVIVIQVPIPPFWNFKSIDFKIGSSIKIAITGLINLISNSKQNDKQDKSNTQGGLTSLIGMDNQDSSVNMGAAIQAQTQQAQTQQANVPDKGMFAGLVKAVTNKDNTSQAPISMPQTLSQVNGQAPLSQMLEKTPLGQKGDLINSAQSMLQQATGTKQAPAQGTNLLNTLKGAVSSKQAPAQGTNLLNTLKGAMSSNQAPAQGTSLLNKLKDTAKAKVQESSLAKSAQSLVQQKEKTQGMFGDKLKSAQSLLEKGGQPSYLKNTLSKALEKQVVKAPAAPQPPPPPPPPETKP